MLTPKDARDGRGERIRTSDPLLPKQVLYQAEPRPDVSVGCRVEGRRPGGLIDAGVSVAESWRRLRGSREVAAREKIVFP